MSYSICRPTSSKYRTDLFRKWNSELNKSLGPTRFKTVRNLTVEYPSDFCWMSMELIGKSNSVFNPKNENVQLEILALVCREMLKTDHTSAKVLLTWVDDACQLFERYQVALRDYLDFFPADKPFISEIGGILQDTRIVTSCGLTIHEAFFQFLRIWVSAFQSFIEMTEYRYEVWGYTYFNRFAADYVL